MTPNAVFELMQVQVDVRKCWGCVCAISCCTFLYLQYIYLDHTCVLRSEFGHVWLLTTLVYLLKLLYVNLRGWQLYGSLCCPLCVFIHFSTAFCMAHCALNLARDYVP